MEDIYAIRNYNLRQLNRRFAWSMPISIILSVAVSAYWLWSLTGVMSLIAVGSTSVVIPILVNMILRWVLPDKLYPYEVENNGPTKE